MNVVLFSIPPLDSKILYPLSGRANCCFGRSFTRHSASGWQVPWLSFSYFFVHSRQKDVIFSLNRWFTRKDSTGLIKCLESNVAWAVLALARITPKFGMASSIHEECIFYKTSPNQCQKKANSMPNSRRLWWVNEGGTFMFNLSDSRLKFIQFQHFYGAILFYDMRTQTEAVSFQDSIVVYNSNTCPGWKISPISLPYHKKSISSYWKK